MIFIIWLSSNNICRTTRDVSKWDKLSHQESESILCAPKIRGYNDTSTSLRDYRDITYCKTGTWSHTRNLWISNVRLISTICGLVKIQITGPPPQRVSFSWSGVDLRICTCNKLPGDADAAGPDHTWSLPAGEGDGYLLKEGREQLFTTTLRQAWPTVLHSSFQLELPASQGARLLGHFQSRAEGTHLDGALARHFLINRKVLWWLYYLKKKFR